MLNAGLDKMFYEDRETFMKIFTSMNGFLNLVVLELKSELTTYRIPNVKQTNEYN